MILPCIITVPTMHWQMWKVIQKYHIHILAVMLLYSYLPFTMVTCFKPTREEFQNCPIKVERSCPVGECKGSTMLLFIFGYNESDVALWDVKI